MSVALEKLMTLENENRTLRARVTELEAQKNGAYFERNQVVAALAKCFPSVVTKTAIEGWSEDWHGCVYIDLPTGQVSWHFHDSQTYLFSGINHGECAWDGHDTPEKYRRVNALSPTYRKELEAWKREAEKQEPVAWRKGEISALKRNDGRHP